MDSVSSASNSGEGDSIKIFLRVRPPDSSISENDFAPRVLDVNTKDNAIILRTKPEPKIFTYDNVADADITQEEVFSIVGKKIIESCVAGYNGTIFAYGQTGSGKTFTMLGPSENSDSFQHELRGVIPRSFEYLFNLIAHQTELHGTKKQFLCRCSFLEIYQEQVFDLLDPTSQGLHLRENMNKGVFVDGLVEEVIDNPGDAYQVLITGWLNRRVAATSMNRESSRSHAVFTVTIESKVKPIGEDEGGIQNIRTSQLNLVDLAGSERQKDTNTGGTRLKEAGSINKSLSVLGNVIMSLVELSNGKKRHVPYRDSKLTFLLRDSLGGNTKTTMVACVHPDSKCFQESLSTLNFARSAKLIKNKAVVNEDFHGSNQKLQNEIRRLKELLETHQANPAPARHLSIPVEVPASAMSADSVWKRKFFEAMHFREVSESEKKTLQDVVNHLQELCNKKDKYIQSAKMIIKFRENNIQTLQKAAAGSEELEKDTLVKSLRDEIHELRHQLEQNPQLAKYAGENKHLRSELKRLRSQEALEGRITDTQRVTELERVFKELKLFNGDFHFSDVNVPKSSPARHSPLKEALTSATQDKHRKEIKDYQEQIETTKQQLIEMKKWSDSRHMEMEVDLVSQRRMITELERVSKERQERQLIECNALKDLHCQTLKVMTTPKLNTSVKIEGPGTPVPGTPVAGESCMPDNSSSQPEDLAEGARDALMEEIQSLQWENGKLKEHADRYEDDMLRLGQNVEKLELYNTQLNAVLDKERTENTARRNDYTSAVSTLKDEIDTIKTDLKLLNEENSDLYLVLKSTDNKLKEEKERNKGLKAGGANDKAQMEERLGAAMINIQKTTKEFDEALKELTSLKEELETNRLTVDFLESHNAELEARVAKEVREREQLDHAYKTLRGKSSESNQSYQAFKEQAECSIKMKQAELESVRAEQERMIMQQGHVIHQNKEAMASLVGRLQDLKGKYAVMEERCGHLQGDHENLSLELHESKKDQDLTSGELTSVQAELKKSKERWETQLMGKDFQIDNLQQDQDSMNTHLMRQEEVVAQLQATVEGRESQVTSLQSQVEGYKARLNDTEVSMSQVAQEYQEKWCELLAMDGQSERVTRLVQGHHGDMEVLRTNYQKLDCVIKDYENARKEKNHENEKLKSSLRELDAAHAALQREGQDMQEVHQGMLGKVAKHREMIKAMEESLQSKDQDLLKERRKAMEAATKLSQTQQDFKSWTSKLEGLETDREHFKQEVERLQGTLETHHQEKSDLHSKIESLNEEKAKLGQEYHILTQRCEHLEEESARLMGHNNHSQKIRLMEKRNQEYTELQRYNNNFCLPNLFRNMKNCFWKQN